MHRRSNDAESPQKTEHKRKRSARSGSKRRNLSAHSRKSARSNESGFKTQQDGYKSGEEQSSAKKGIINKFMSFINNIGGALIIKKPKLGVQGYNLQNDSHHTHQ